MGIVAQVNGQFHYFNGNQIGALLLNDRIRSTAHIQNRAAVKSIVTSELGRKIAEANDVTMFDVLTGFKFIAEKLHSLKRNMITIIYSDMKKVTALWPDRSFEIKMPYKLCRSLLSLQAHLKTII